MAWSLSYNGYVNSSIRDTYHRIGVSCSLQEIANPEVQAQFKRYIELGFCHIVVHVDGSCRPESNILSDVHDFLKSLKTPFSTIDVIWSLVFHVIDDCTSETISQLRPHNCILPYQESKSVTKDIFKTTMERISWEEKGSMSLGIKDIPKTGYDLEEIQATLEYFNGDETENRWLKLMDMNDMELPSLKLRAVDFAHARGLNVFIHIPTPDINYVKPSLSSVHGYECILDMAGKYGKDKYTILIKVLLQMGFTPIIPLSSISENFMLEHVAPIVHPFSIRRTFFSQTEIKRIVIQQEDVDLVASISEEEECKADSYWQTYATHVAPQRILQDRKALNVTTSTTEADLRRFEDYVQSDLAKHVRKDS